MMTKSDKYTLLPAPAFLRQDRRQLRTRFSSITTFSAFIGSVSFISLKYRAVESACVEMFSKDAGQGVTPTFKEHPSVKVSEHLRRF